MSALFRVQTLMMREQKWYALLWIDGLLIPFMPRSPPIVMSNCLLDAFMQYFTRKFSKSYIQKYLGLPAVIDVFKKKQPAHCWSQSHIWKRKGKRCPDHLQLEGCGGEYQHARGACLHVLLPYGQGPPQACRKKSQVTCSWCSVGEHCLVRWMAMFMVTVIC